jgi:endonuclease/exonuclease/phosphatase (EEP) superfamily protein YafD
MQRLSRQVAGRASKREMRFARLVVTALFWPPVFVGATLCAAAALAAQAGRWNPGLDLLTHFAPFYLAGGLLAVLSATVFQDRARTWVLTAGLIAVMAAGALIVPEYLRSTGPKAGNAAGETLKLIQFNIWDGDGGVDRAIAWLVAQQPDVVVIEESSRSVRNRIVARTGWRVAGSLSSVMIFSRNPAVEWASLTEDIDGRPELTHATFSHYTWPTRGGQQQAQGRIVAELLKPFPKDSTILAGDFNSTPWSFARRHDDAAFGLIRRTRALASWPAGRHRPLPFLPIDHVYAGDGWATVKVERGPNVGSDHYPVVVTLRRVAPR